MTDALERLIAGFRAFHDTYFQQNRALYDRLATEGQSPKVLVVGCSDARVDPAIVTYAQPGDLFVVRNVAAIVPPHEEAGLGYHGTSSALEFGVRGLNVEHIVVLGHALCGGMRALAEGPAEDRSDYEYLHDWVRIAAAARDAVRAELRDAPAETQRRALEQAGVVVSLGNLMTFPWVRERVVAGTLALHGWYFDFTVGELFAYDIVAGRFAPVTGRAYPLSRDQQADFAEGLDVRRFVHRMAVACNCVEAAGEGAAHDHAIPPSRP